MLLLLKYVCNMTIMRNELCSKVDIFSSTQTSSCELQGHINLTLIIADVLVVLRAHNLD